jgi:hypothetical protein
MGGWQVIIWLEVFCFREFFEFCIRARQKKATLSAWLFSF